MKKINIDEYSIIHVRRLRSIKDIAYHERYGIFSLEKFAIVNNKIKYDKYHLSKGYMVDVLTDEKYYLESGYYDELNTLYVDCNYRFLSLNQVLNIDKQYIKKKDFLNLCREYIIKLNNEALDVNQKRNIDIINGKIKVLNLNSSNQKNKEEE